MSSLPALACVAALVLSARQAGSEPPPAEQPTPDAAATQGAGSSGSTTAPTSGSTSGSPGSTPGSTPALTPGSTPGSTAAPAVGPASGATAAASAPSASTPAADSPAPPMAGEKVVAVLDLKADEDVVGLGNAVAAMIASDVEARPGLRAVSRNELRSVLSNAADAQLMGCDTVNCMSDIARLADASLLVSGSLARVAGVADGASANPGTALVLSLSLLDPSVPAVVSRSEATWRGKPEELITAVPAILDRLIDGAAAASYVGALELFVPPEATVTIDGAPARAGKNDALPIGVRTVEVSQPGYITFRNDVAVLRNATSVLRVELEPEPFYTQWWFWTGVGVGTAAAVAGGVIIYMEAFGTQPPTVLKVDAPLPAALTR